MNIWKLIRSSLIHYRGVNLAVMGGVALTSAILSGALVVGDSVKESLRRNAASRISGVGPALMGGEHFFTSDLAGRISKTIDGGAIVAPVLQVQGTVSSQGGAQRVNRVQIVGVDDRFWKLSRNGKRPAKLQGNQWMAVNQALAARVGSAVAETLVVKVEIPGALSRDAPLSGESEQTTPFTGRISAVLGASDFGLYSLRAEQVSPATVFLPLTRLQEILKQAGKANVLLCQEDISTDAFKKAAQAQWDLDDVSLNVSRLENPVGEQVVSPRIFLDDTMEENIRKISSQTSPVLTYLANVIRKGDKSTPYSMVTGVGPEMNQIVPDSMSDTQIILSAWLAEDLGAVIGDRISLEYYVVGSGRKLREKSSTFTVSSILPIGKKGWDAKWTPDFPGIFDVDGLDKWEPGIPIRKDRIRDKDEAFWDQYKATPKAFVTIGAARKMWGNRFGQATAIRFQRSSPSATIADDLRKSMTLEDVGLSFRNLSEEAHSAVAQSLDFGQLFAYMSFFIIISALVLTGLVFVFGIEQRGPQIGLFLALGFTRKKVRRLFSREAMVLALIGSLAGLLGGYLYTRLALAGMSGAWRDAAAGIEFVYFVRPISLLIALGTTLLFSWLVVWLASRRVMKIQPSELITGSEESVLSAAIPGVSVWKWKSLYLTLLAILGGVGCLAAPKEPGSMAEQGLFFGAGFLFVLAGVAACSVLIQRLGKPSRTLTSLAALGRQYTLRRKGRSLSVVGLMAAGVFMVSAVNSFRLDGKRGAQRRNSGTGGFAYVGESTLPIYEDLNGPAGRKKYGLDSIIGKSKVEIIAFRVSDGEDASCLNLNRAQRPRLMAVSSEAMAKLNPFHFMETLKSGKDATAWNILESDGPNIPGVIDMNTATYALGKKLGDSIRYEGENGKPFFVKISALLDTSILQGSVIIDEKAFVRMFPGEGGYQYFLIDGKDESVNKAVAEHLTRMFEDRGLEMRPAAQRLNEYNAVQNTYLSIFSTLGGLGVLLGTVGLAIVVGRNVMERRGQLGVMQAMGFTRKALSNMVLSEHWFLHLAGVVIGLVAAVIAVIPKLSAGLSGLPFGLLTGVNLAILAGGLLFCWLATRALIRGNLMDGLRRE